MKALDFSRKKANPKRVRGVLWCQRHWLLQRFSFSTMLSTARGGLLVPFLCFILFNTALYYKSIFISALCRSLTQRKQIRQTTQTTQTGANSKHARLRLCVDGSLALSLILFCSLVRCGLVARRPVLLLTAYFALLAPPPPPEPEMPTELLSINADLTVEVISCDRSGPHSSVGLFAPASASPRFPQYQFSTAQFSG